MTASGFTIVFVTPVAVTSKAAVTGPLGQQPAGRFVIVAVTRSLTVPAVTAIDDGGDTYVSATTSTDAACPGATDLWYTQANGTGGASTTVSFASVTNAEVTFIGIDGATSFIGAASLDSQASATTPSSPVRNAPGVPAAYVAAVQSCGNLQGPSGPPFTAYAPVAGGDVSSYLSPGTASARADWVSSKATYTSSILELH